MTPVDPVGGINIPPMPQGGTTGTAIGVPVGYVPPTEKMSGPIGGGRGATWDVTSQGTIPYAGTYNEGDQFKPQILPPADVYALQKQLVTAGALSATNIRPGVWDTDSANAYKAVLSFANATGMSASDALKVMVANPQTGAQTQRAPFQLTAPAEITAQVSGGGPHQSNVARETIGHDLPAGETNNFLKWYQDQEAAARKQYLAADLAGPGNSYTGAPNLGVAAQQYIKEKHLGESVAYGTASRMFSFFDLLKGVV